MPKRLLALAISIATSGIGLTTVLGPIIAGALRAVFGSSPTRKRRSSAASRMGGSAPRTPRGRLDDAQDIVGACHHAARLRHADPGPWTVLLGVLRDLRRNPREGFPVWDEIIRRDPWHREGYLQMLGYLSPEECGSSTQQNAFVDSAMARMPFGAPPAALEPHVLLGRYRRAVTGDGLTGLLADRIFNQPFAESVLSRALSTWPRPGFLRHAAALADLNVLAYLAAHARHRDAANAFRAVGATVTPWPWRLGGDPLEQYSTWRKYFPDPRMRRVRSLRARRPG
ncbi:hypothetical protein ACH4U7_48980 [Streptomyces sp. NPDC020845]|uniref:hypothetical protein n=1 Tax=Streptomyces sp. NPDC020845 TaxID=3365096 RepID=UPI0037B71FFE